MYCQLHSKMWSIQVRLFGCGWWIFSAHLFILLHFQENKVCLFMFSSQYLHFAQNCQWKSSSVTVKHTIFFYFMNRGQPQFDVSFLLDLNSRPFSKLVISYYELPCISLHLQCLFNHHIFMLFSRCVKSMVYIQL